MKNDIINQEISVSELIDETKIAVKYSVRKTPIREALNRLVQNGYLLKYPRRGYIVKEIKLKEYFEIV
ncbi:MAG: GntR family transcriptional regulator [Clostridiales bacterium]|jgi:DNA-binding GntR family transcriptional regulator|nr:GntR family transcriptional regulator [Clostridiales bacterium]